MDGLTRETIAGISVRWEAIDELIGVYVARDPDQLLEELCADEFSRSDERMPYFANVWPAARHLVAYLRAAADEVRDRRVLDLGCGVGLVGLEAARLGAHASFLDWESRALDFVRASAARQRLDVESLIAADWREPPRMGSFDLVLAADVLYEPRNLVAVAEFSARVLSPGGRAFIGDPGRNTARDFPGIARSLGLKVDETSLESGRIYRISR